MIFIRITLSVAHFLPPMTLSMEQVLSLVDVEALIRSHNSNAVSQIADSHSGSFMHILVQSSHDVAGCEVICWFISGTPWFRDENQYTAGHYIDICNLPISIWILVFIRLQYRYQCWNIGGNILSIYWSSNESILPISISILIF